MALCWLASPAFASDDELSDLRRAIKELQAANRELARRLIVLEGQKPDPASTDQKATRQIEKPRGEFERTESQQELAQRVRELELAKAAQEQATRLIIQDTLAKTGSKINESVTLGGSIETLAVRGNDFSSSTASSLKFNAADLDLEIQLNPWTLGTLVLEYVDGTGTRSGSRIASTTVRETAIDRINLNRASVTIGDIQRFPLYLQAGLQTLPFGTSTGLHRVDVLSIDSPLTTDAFETRKTAVGLGFGLPTPVPTRASPPVFAPRVNPLVISPLINSFAQGAGYRPVPTRLKPASPVAFAPDPPPFYGSLHFYDNADTGAAARNFTSNYSGRLGYRASGHCGRPYYELSRSGLCPWSLDVSLDYNRSVFNSRFLASEYRGFASQIGAIGGLAASAKATLGPVALVGEWIAATKQAVFQDDLGKSVRIKPGAWQVSAAYQFDWNPWINNIGAQGTFVAVGYSQTRDLAGATQLTNTVPTRVGFLPKRRLTLTAGEWILDGVKLVVEYSRTVDYSLNEGGTGRSGKGIAAALSYTF
jgi:hypothetical protein